MYNFRVGVGNCSAKSKLPGVPDLEKTTGQYFLSKESYFFTLRNLAALMPQSGTGPPALAQGPGPWCWACSPAVAMAGSRRGPRAVDTTPHPVHARSSPPRGLHFHRNGTPRGMGHGPQPRCCRVGQLLMGAWGGQGARPHQPGFFHLLCFPSSKEHHGF